MKERPVSLIWSAQHSKRDKEIEKGNKALPISWTALSIVSNWTSGSSWTMTERRMGRLLGWGSIMCSLPSGQREGVRKMKEEEGKNVELGCTEFILAPGVAGLLRSANRMSNNFPTLPPPPSCERGAQPPFCSICPCRWPVTFNKLAHWAKRLSSQSRKPATKWFFILCSFAIAKQNNPFRPSQFNRKIKWRGTAASREETTFAMLSPKERRSNNKAKRDISRSRSLSSR